MKAFNQASNPLERRIKVEMYQPINWAKYRRPSRRVLGTIEVVVPATAFFRPRPRFQTLRCTWALRRYPARSSGLTDPEVRKRLATFGASKGVEPLVVYPHSPLMLLSHKTRAHLADIRGQKIRVPGSARCISAVQETGRVRPCPCLSAR